jgi:hypothetical protein
MFIKQEFEGLRGRVEKVGGMIGNLIKVLKRGQ